MYFDNIYQIVETPEGTFYSDRFLNAQDIYENVAINRQTIARAKQVLNANREIKTLLNEKYMTKMKSATQKDENQVIEGMGKYTPRFSFRRRR